MIHANKLIPHPLAAVKVRLVLDQCVQDWILNDLCNRIKVSHQSSNGEIRGISYHSIHKWTIATTQILQLYGYKVNLMLHEPGQGYLYDITWN